MFALIRFLLNFIFFGLLFYLLWIYQPAIFNRLVAGADSAVGMLRSFFGQFKF